MGKTETKDRSIQLFQERFSYVLEAYVTTSKSIMGNGGLRLWLDNIEAQGVSA